MKAHLILVALGLALLGGVCGSPPSNVVRFEPQAPKVPPFTQFTLDVVIELNAENLRAWDFTATVNPSVASPTNALPHPEFDDDGQLFVAPQVDAGAGTIARIVDVQHGGPGATGTIRLATLVLTSGASGVANLTLSNATFVLANGETLAPTIRVANITVTP